MPGSASQGLYVRVLESAGFYRNGRPLKGVTWTADDLRAVLANPAGRKTDDIDRAFKYQAVLRPEQEGGRIGVTDIFELCGRSPCIYFKHLDAEPDAAELTKKLLAWQKVAWNHGRAPILWVVTPTQVRILNAYARPPVKQDLDSLRKIEIRQFERIADQLTELQNVASRERIASGEFWKQAGSSIDRKNRVDRQLIADLASAAQRLTECDLTLADAHRLVLRGVFASYLQARGWLPKALLQNKFGVSDFKEALAEQRTAEQLFDWLATTFNGDVFPHKPAQRYTAAQLRELKFLLDGGDPKSGQRYLWPYEFDVVPIELLSSIYEQFTHALNPELAQTQSTHYTPINLVDLTLSQVFDDHLFGDTLPLDAKVADLACGSGVFLVESLRRLLAKRIAAGEKLTRKLVRDTLYNQIFGIDLNPGAIHIAAVSLYLATLELDPKPSLRDGVRFLPLIYPKDDKDRQTQRDSWNLFEADAFDPDSAFNSQSPFADKQFDVVVGNPPWTRPSMEGASASLGKKTAPSHITYCRKQEPPVPLPYQSPPDQAFVWRAGLDFAREGARIGLIISALRFFSHQPDSVSARQSLLTRFAPRVMLNLSRLRQDRLFWSATHPAMLFVAANKAAQPSETFTFGIVERSTTFRRHGVLEIGPELLKRLSLRRVASEKNFLRVATWGTARDMSLIEHLEAIGQPLEELFRSEGHSGVGQGLIFGNRKKPMPEKLIGRLEVTAQMRRFAIRTSELRACEETHIHSKESVNLATFQAPALLVKSGTTNNRTIAAFCNDDVVFSQRIFAIPLSEEHTALAGCLNGILNSSLTAYYMFLTSSSWGIERDKITLDDLRRMPVPAMDQIAQSAVSQLLELVDDLRLRSIKGNTTLNAADAELDAAVYALYGLEHRQQVLVDDMLGYTIDLHQNGDRSAAVQPPKIANLKAYAEHFISVLSDYLSIRNERTCIAEVFKLPQSSLLRIVKFRMVKKPAHAPKVQTVEHVELAPLLDQISAHLPERISDRVHTRRNLRVYGPSEVYIIKPAEARFWSRSAGLNDADAVLAEHMETL